MGCTAETPGQPRTVVIDPEAIQGALLNTRGKDSGTFRRSRPKLPHEPGGVYGAAYVWRMIRFHAGLDMCMPVAANDYIGVGWIQDETDKAVLTKLDQLVDQLGARLFGPARMFRAAARWGQAMYGSDAKVGGKDSDGPTYGELADALGVSGVDGLDIGGPTESPEHFVEQVLLDNDGQTQLSPDELAAHADD